MATGLTASIEATTQGFAALVKTFPKVKAEVMHYIGKKGASVLDDSLLSGQELNLTRRVDRKGRYTITNKVGKLANSVSIKSYVVNPFERGRTLRNGKREPAKRIITSKLKTLVNANISTWAAQAEREIIQKEFDKI